MVGIHGKTVLDGAPAGEHQAIVGVELGELTFADLHAQGYPLPDRIKEIGPDKGQLVLSAHAGRAFKGHKAHRAAVENKFDPLRPEQVFRQFLQCLHPTNCAAVKDAGEVQPDKRSHKAVLGIQDRLAI